MNGIVVMTTHDEKEIMESDKCLVMCEGHLREVTEGCRKMEQIRKLMGDAGRRIFKDLTVRSE